MYFDTITVQGRLYSKKKLTLDWFQMSNDAFYRIYGFNFNPHEHEGPHGFETMYDWGRNELYRR